MLGRVIRWLPILAVVAVVGVGAAMAATASMRSGAGTVKAVKNSKYGMVLVNSSGRSLYRYMADSKGVSRCTGACAGTWPPLLVKGNAKPTAGAGASAHLLGTIKRAPGAVQVSYAGFPLYRYSGDTRPGQTNGEGFAGKWYVVNAKGALVKHAVAAAPASTTKSSGGGGWG